MQVSQDTSPLGQSATRGLHKKLPIITDLRNEPSLSLARPSQQERLKPREGPGEHERNRKTEREKEGKHENGIGETPSNER